MHRGARGAGMLGGCPNRPAASCSNPSIVLRAGPRASSSRVRPSGLTTLPHAEADPSARQVAQSLRSVALAERHDTMMNPHIEGLLDRTSSKFRLVTLASQRARQINAYFGHLGDGLGTAVPPQVTSLARKPLSIAFEEIAADKIIGVAVASADDFDGIEGATLEGGEYAVEAGGGDGLIGTADAAGDNPPADGGA